MAAGTCAQSHVSHLSQRPSWASAVVLPGAVMDCADLLCPRTVYVSTAGNCTWLDSSHYWKRWHNHFPFLLFFFFFPSTEAEISNEAKRKMILLSEREREELGKWFILPRKHSCVHQIHKQGRARSRGKICSCFHGPLAALAAWPWAGKEEKQP